MWRHQKKTLYNPEREAFSPRPQMTHWYQISSLQICEERNFYCLSHPNFSMCYSSPRKVTETLTIVLQGQVLESEYHSLNLNTTVYQQWEIICLSFLILKMCIVTTSASSVQFSCSVMSDSLWPHELQHIRSPCPSPAPRVHPNPCPLSQWCHPTISSSVVPFSSCPQSFPASGSFQMNQLFTSGGQSTGVSASASVLPMNTQDWSPLGWTGWISLQSKGLSRVFSNTTVQKHHFFSTQLSL